MNPVYITRLARFLPNDPVSNQDMEGVLGAIGGLPSKARAIVLRNNGIRQRYYAYANGRSTHTNTQMGAAAVRGLFDETLPIEKLELLAVGTSSPEQLLPSQAAMIHGELRLAPVEIVSTTGACCCSVQALKYAAMSVASGNTTNAAVVGTEKVSTWMHASRFQAEAENLARLEENPYIAFEKDFLRWMLSDGAAAALVQPAPDPKRISLRIEWIEITSFAGELETCMYGGAVKGEDGQLTGWNDISPADWTVNSVFTVKQDTRLLAANIVERGGVFLKSLIGKHGLAPEGVDYFLPHMSSEFFRKPIQDHLSALGMHLSDEKWFYNLTRVGNVGAASVFLMLEELVRTVDLKKGQKILVMVPESARFTYAYLYLTVA